MTPLSTFPLPLRLDQPPSGYGWEERDISILSTTTAFDTGINQRDKFLGEGRCIICGEGKPLQRCHIIMQSHPSVWFDLRNRCWIPWQAKESPLHEPRNGLLMCANHHHQFDEYDFFIRFLPDVQRFVLVNFSNSARLQQFHGKAIALDVRNRHSPFPSLFIIHEMRVRGFHPFQPVEPAMPDDGPWQDWILSDGVRDNVSGSFKRVAPKRDGPSGKRDNNDNSFSAQSQPQFQPTTMSTGDTVSGGRKLALNADVIADILAATRAMPSWRACQVEGTSWTGTAEENMQKYVSSIGVEDVGVEDV